MTNEPSKLPGRLLLLLNLCASTLGAATAVVLFVRPIALGVAAEEAESGRVLLLPVGTPMGWAVFLAALSLLLCNFGWLVRRSPRPLPRDFLMSSTSAGPVRIAREALESGLRATGEDVADVTRLRVQVDCAQQKRIVIKAALQCAEGASNHECCQRLRLALERRFLDMVHLGEGARADFELEFQGFFGKPSRKGSQARSAVEPEPEPFSGPKYPIDDEDGGS